MSNPEVTAATRHGNVSTLPLVHNGKEKVLIVGDAKGFIPALFPEKPPGLKSAVNSIDLAFGRGAAEIFFVEGNRDDLGGSSRVPASAREEAERHTHW